MYADAVIEGGGVKAIGLVGAIYEAEKRGYEWSRIAGTSAGAIIGAMLASGYTAEELRDEIIELDYTKFIEKKGILRIPVAGTIINLFYHYGVYSGDYIEEWVRSRLIAKGVRTFKDLKKTLYIIASDITSGEMITLPNDLINYGIKPEDFEVAKAVRMSASIPYFFQPEKLKLNNEKKNAHYIVDGGLLSNFPVWIFDNPDNPRWPTFGFRIVSKDTGKPNKITGPLTLGFALINTMLEAHDMRHIKEQDYVRTIFVPSLGITTTDFDITREQSTKLFNAGVEAGKIFFNDWSFSQYVIKYRSPRKLV